MANSFTAASKASFNVLAFSGVVGPATEPFVLGVISPVVTFTPSSSTVTELLAGFTLKLTSLVVLPSRVVTTAVVPRPLMKFTVSYGFTKSFAVPLFCKFQPALNTSPTVAALFAAKLGFLTYFLGSVVTLPFSSMKSPSSFVMNGDIIAATTV